jgi:hypothetical protein
MLEQHNDTARFPRRIPCAKMTEYFCERTRGVVGLIISGLVSASQGIYPSVTEPGNQSYFPRRAFQYRRRAHFLAGERGTTVIEMLPALMKGVCTSTRGYLIQYLEKLDVNLITMAIPSPFAFVGMLDTCTGVVGLPP